MARQRKVTRTITTTEVTALCVDTTTAATCEMTFNLAGTYKGEKEMLKALEAHVASLPEITNTRPVFIKAFELRNVLYEMLETEFLAHARLSGATEDVKADDEKYDNTEADDSKNSEIKEG